MTEEVFYHEISLKGSFPAMFVDRLTLWGYCDLKKSFGKFILKGTEKEYEDFRYNVIGFNEKYYKVIGTRSIKESEYDPTGKLILTKDSKI